MLGPEEEAVESRDLQCFQSCTVKANALEEQACLCCPYSEAIQEPERGTIHELQSSRLQRYALQISLLRQV